MAQKRERTPEQIKADTERMARVRAARQNKQPETVNYSVEQNPVTNEVTNEVISEVTNKVPLPELPEQTKVDISTPDIGDLMKQIQELKDMQFMLMADALKGQKSGPAVANGQLTGTVEKYILDPNHYPDPRDRLRTEPKLQRFAFDMNYELSWIISESRYETIDHIRTVEPKFTLVLTRVLLDEFTGKDTNGRYDIAQIIMHEDPTAAVMIAAEQGLDISREDETVFLNEMRYIRLRDWLIDCFYPPAPTTAKQKRDMVIDGKLVQYYEKNVEEGSGSGITKVDWDKLPKVKF